MTLFFCSPRLALGFLSLSIIIIVINIPIDPWCHCAAKIPPIFQRLTRSRGKSGSKSYECYIIYYFPPWLGPAYAVCLLLNYLSKRGSVASKLTAVRISFVLGLSATWVYKHQLRTIRELKAPILAMKLQR